MGPIRNSRWEQKRTEGYVIVYNIRRATHVTNTVISDDERGHVMICSQYKYV